MPTSAATLTSVNPATEAEVESFALLSPAELDGLMDAVDAARPGWVSLGVERRCQLLRSLAAHLRDNSDHYSRHVTTEMGKPLAEARAEVEKCASACDHFAAAAPGLLADEDAPSDGSRSYIRYEPLGTLLACMPWNYPFWQVFRCIAPALAAGNTVVLKHANNVYGCALDIEAALLASGFPENVMRTAVIGVESVAGLIADPRIAAVSLTGSTAAGRSVGAAAGSALKKSVLELGGSDAFIVLEDADIEAAAAMAVRSRFQNAGQSCIAAKRFIVVDSVAGAFIDAMVARVAALRVGDPTDATTEMGPLARADLRDRIEAQITQSVRMGARLLTGGVRPEGPGFFLSPAVVGDCTTAMPVFTEETFGPVAAVIGVRDEHEAVAVANASEFGLGGNVWTADVERGLAVAVRLESGAVFINGMTHSDPRLPFGGVKASGYGRELHRFGLHEFLNVKTVWLGR